LFPCSPVSSTAWAQDNDYSDSSPASQEPVYPGIAPQGKAEATIGSQKLRIYGTFLLNISGSDSVDVGQDLVLWPVPGGSVTFPDGTTKPNSRIHDLIFTARQSVFGFQFKLRTLHEHVARFRYAGIRFFGGRPFDANQPQGRVLNEPRLRLAYLQFQKEISGSSRVRTA
jgi:hypothetical protein